MPEAAARRPNALTRLIDALARLYVDVESSRLVVQRAEMDPAVIAFDARALVNWTNITDEALRQKAIQRLIAVADEMYPDVPELKAAMRESADWTEELTAQPPPKLWERAKFGIVVTVLTVLASFAVIGIVSRESQHGFYNVPAHSHNVLSHPDEWTAEGFDVITRTLMVAVEYLMLNPLGAILMLILVGVIVYAVVKWQKQIARFTKPAIAVPALILLALVKSYWYDMPTLYFENVLDTRSFDMTSFDIPPHSADRARQIWQPVVCSRLAGDPNAADFCGNTTRSAQLQQVDGRYLLDVLFTVGLWSIGIRIIRKLMLPSRELAWNLPQIWRRAFLTGAGIALFIAILGVPWAYARTAQSMREERVCVRADCYFRLCIDAHECFDYTPPGDWRPSRPIPQDAAAPTKEDILDAAFKEQLQSANAGPPP